MKKDLEFLKEMKQLSESLIKDRYDIVKVQQIDQMLGDWIDDLSSQNNELVIQPVSGSLLLNDLFKVAAIENEDGMAVIKYIDKPNGGSVAYIRHDAMVNGLNALLKQ